MDRFGSDVPLKDGSLVHVRRLRPDDHGLLRDFFGGLSNESVAFRFLGTGIDLQRAMESLLADSADFAIVSLREGKIIALASLHPLSRDSSKKAEVGIAISDQYQGMGLGTIILGQLAEAANSMGITELEAVVAPENYRMIEVLRNMGLPSRQTAEPGLLRISYPTSLLPDSIKRFEEREASSALAAVQSILQPQSVAVIGASRELGTIGGELFRNILEGEFNGPAYPVNNKARVVQSVSAYGSILDCPGSVDMAVITVPASAVVSVAKECAQKGVKALVVISAGFAESGEGGRELQRELVEVCRKSGMRLVGPNCMGVVNTEPEVRLNAQFSPLKPASGTMGFLSQSGALGIAVIDLANRLGLGLSSFVSVGNKADISSNDLLEYWEKDERTKVILLYLESFGNPRKFSRIARRLAKRKPIIAVKSGRSIAGFRATQSHTGALVAASDVTVDALFRRSGVIRTDTLEEMFDVAALLSSQPLPKGGRVSILTNAGGAGILAADACEDLGLDVPELSPPTQEVLRGLLPQGAGVRNPVDMTASAGAKEFGQAIRTMSKDPLVDAMIVIFVPPIQIRPQDVAAEIMGAVSEMSDRMPVLATFMATHGIQDLLSSGGQRVPSYPFPEVAVHSLARAVHYGRWLQEPEGNIPEFDDVRMDEAMSIIAEALRKGGEGWLSQNDVAALLECYGIHQVKTLTAGSPIEAGIAASKLGVKVVLKAVAPGLIHKTDAGAVRLGLQGQSEVEKSAEDMRELLYRTGSKVTEYLVQPLVTDATEMFAGITHDPIFGPVVVCGAGGTRVELIKDVAVRLTPLTDVDAREMVRSLKTFPMLNGYRGVEKGDVAAFEQLLLRTGMMANEISAIKELDLNPVMVMRKGVVVVDSRVLVLKDVGSPPLPLGAKKR